MRYLNGYTNDEEEYKALMDAGIAYAKEYNLKPGIALRRAVDCPLRPEYRRMHHSRDHVRISVPDDKTV